MSIVFHGTSIQNARKILKHGFNPKKRNWKNSDKLAYFFNCPTYHESLKNALVQGGTAAYRYTNECRRAVLAVDIPDGLLTPDDTKTAGIYSYQYEGSTITPDMIVGCWHDKLNLSYLRPFALIAHEGKVHLKNYKIPENISKLRAFFEVPKYPIYTNITQQFCHFNLGFDVNIVTFII
jgi:hypothetical protein